DIGACSCPIGMSSAPCKHQGAVSVKFHLSIVNFFPSLTPDDCMTYAYIALGDQETLHMEMEISSNSLIIENKETEKFDSSEFTSLLVVNSDYQNGGSTLHATLNKFKDRYIAARTKSISRLSSFLYDINRDLDPMVHAKSDSRIRVQVESIRRRKTEMVTASKNKAKETLDPQNIPVRKKKKNGKKA
ncbi:29658_t:CDS:2, partial [Racocetra persica]